MAEDDALLRALAGLVCAGRDWNRVDVNVYAERAATALELSPHASPETVAGALREALGMPGPRSVTYDMADKDAWLALDTALEDFSVTQRDRAGHERGNERGNERRHEWADLADRMRAEATAARAAGWQEGPGGK